MAENILKYAVLQYMPMKEIGERINLGILFSEENTGYREFRHIKRFSRLSSFDDELDLQKVKAVLGSISEDVEEGGDSSFSIEDYTKFFINSYYFEKPQITIYENLEETVERIYRIYLRYDLPKERRNSIEDDRKFLQEIMVGNGISVRKSGTVLGTFDDRIRYDLISDDVWIKIFDFDGKDINKLMTSIRSWAWTCAHDVDKKTVLVYRYSGSKEEPTFKIAMNILNAAHANVYDIEESASLFRQAKRA